MILSICDNVKVLEIMRLIKIVIKIICISVPIIMIVSSMIMILGEMKDGKDEMFSNIGSKIIAKAIAVILIFFIPTFVHLISKLADGDNSYLGCWDMATKEGIREARGRYIDNLILQAFQSLLSSDYEIALSEVNKLDADDRQEYLDKLKVIRGRMDAKYKVADAERLLTEDSYNEALKVVNSLPDDSYKTGLLDRLKAVKEKIDAKKSSGSSRPSGDTSKLEMYFLASGYYDDAILIRNGNNSIFIDGGRYNASNTITSFLKKMGVVEIDLLLGSHLHYDHIQSQAEIIKNFTVDKVTYPDDIFTCRNRGSCDSKDQKYILDTIKKKGINPQVTKPGDTIQVGEMTLYFMEPTKITTSGSYPQNANSSVFILKFKNNTFMFSGDISLHSKQVEHIKKYCKKFGISTDVDVLKYPHHGHASLYDNVLDTVKPEYVIVPNYNSSKYPNSADINRISKHGAKMYRQSDSSTGNIYIASDGNNITVQSNYK